jgi:hypothetical protein
MAEKTNVKINEQFVTRTVRKAVIAFDNADNDADRLRAVMAMSALSALNLVSNRQMVTTTSRFIEAKLRI